MVGIAHPNKLNSYLDGGKFEIMFSWFTRPIIYIRIKPDWVSVKVFIKGRETNLYENIPQVSFRQKIAGNSPKIEILGVGKNASVFSSLNQASEVKQDNPFDHPRSLLKDFDLGCETLKYFIFKAKEGKKAFTLFSSRIFIQPLDKLEGGLTSIERVAFIDLGLQAGAGECYLCESIQELSDEDILSMNQWRRKV